MASTSKGKGGIKTTHWRKHSDKKTSRSQNKQVRKDGKKQIGKEVNEEDEEVILYSQSTTSDYIRFIDAIIKENYASAHKYLKGILSDKIKARIQTQINKPLF